MHLVDYSLNILDQNPGLEGIYQQIELAGRTCYHSQDKITPESAEKFVDMMIKSGHGAMLEHGTVYLYFPWVSIGGLDAKYSHNKYSKLIFYSNNQIDEEGNTVFIPIEYRKAGQYVTTNLRVLVENDWLDDLKYLCEPTEYHEKRITVKFTTGIDITREFNRHRVNSMAEQSTRYCNFSKNKFGNTLSIMHPREFSHEECRDAMEMWCSDYFLSEDNTKEFNQDNIFRNMCTFLGMGRDSEFSIIDTWVFAHLSCEWSYFKLLDFGWKPQQARKVLNLDTQSELVHTAFVSDWKHFLSLRSPKYGATGVHPDAAYLGDMLYDEFRNRNILE